jgi:hypothetical protein
MVSFLCGKMQGKQVKVAAGLYRWCCEVFYVDKWSKCTVTRVVGLFDGTSRRRTGLILGYEIACFKFYFIKYFLFKKYIKIFYYFLKFIFNIII